MPMRKDSKSAKSGAAQVQARLNSETDLAQPLPRLAKELKRCRQELRTRGEQLLKFQAALEESRNRYAELFEFAPIAYVTLDHDGIVIAINLTGAELLGTPRSGVVGLPLVTFIDAADHSRFLEHLYRCRQGGGPEPISGEVKVKRRYVERLIPVQLVTRIAGKPELRAYQTAILDLTERKLAEQKLAQFQQKLASLASELAMAEERERRRIAVEVHDNLSQSLVLAKMKLGAVRRKAAASTGGAELTQGLEEVTQLIDEVLQQTRMLTFDLSPPILYELGFEAALEWLGERFAQRHKLTVHVQAPRRRSDLPERTAILMFQCVRELLTNAAKHADATEVHARVRRSAGLLRVTVQDNGRGFDPRNGRNGESGFGLFSLAARLEHIGGRVDIDSRPGGPTKATLTVPAPKLSKPS